MIFGGITSAETALAWREAEPFTRWVDMLYFPIETLGVLTPFREQVLSYIYRTARGYSDGLLESAIVEAVSEPDEDDSMHLHLALTIKADWEELDKLHDQILERVAQWSNEWRDEEQEDYGRWIFFSLTPSHV